MIHNQKMESDYRSLSLCHSSTWIQFNSIQLNNSIPLLRNTRPFVAINLTTHFDMKKGESSLRRWSWGSGQRRFQVHHYGDVIMGAIAFQITSLTIGYSTVYSDADQRKHQSSASLVFVWGIHRGPVNSPHKWPVTRKMFPFDDVIMISAFTLYIN